MGGHAAALELLVKRLDPRDEVLFAVFADKVGLAVPWTQDHQRVPRAFNALRPGGYTALFDAVKLIVPAFQRAEHSESAARDFRRPRQPGTALSGATPPFPVPASREQQVQSEIYAGRRRCATPPLARRSGR